MNNSVIR